MKNEILEHLHDAGQLERLYRGHKLQFKKTFIQLYPEVKGSAPAEFWHQRLTNDTEDVHWGSGKEIFLVILASLMAGLLAKLPAFFSIQEDVFYPRNVGFIIFPMLAAYFAWKGRAPITKIVLVAATVLASLIFINSLPNNENSDTLILSCLHLLFFLWFLLGYVVVSGGETGENRRLDFLKYNGDLVVMTTLILIAGGIMSGVTIGLFSLIGFQIEQVYFEWVGIFGLAAAPLVGTYLTQTNPQLVGKVSPVIARIFSPLVLVMLAIYLVAMIFSGKNPYNDREYLLVFNALLVGVLAIIFFSVAEGSGSRGSRVELVVLLLLCGLTVLVNAIALSAIVFRISEWGLTPNRLAVLGGNILILVNLLAVTAQFIRVLLKGTEISGVGNAISKFLPVYFFWTGIVTFLFPLIFKFK